VSKDGLLKGAELVFRGKKNTQDYHEEMNEEHFEEHLRLYVTAYNYILHKEWYINTCLLGCLKMIDEIHESKIKSAGNDLQQFYSSTLS
jgi:hypothetical protein